MRNEEKQEKKMIHDFRCTNTHTHTLIKYHYIIIYDVTKSGKNVGQKLDYVFIPILNVNVINYIIN